MSLLGLFFSIQGLPFILSYPSIAQKNILSILSNSILFGLCLPRHSFSDGGRLERSGRYIFVLLLQGIAWASG